MPYRYARCPCQKRFIFQTSHFNFSVSQCLNEKVNPMYSWHQGDTYGGRCQPKWGGGHLLLAMLGTTDVSPEHHRQQSLWQVLPLSHFSLDICLSYFKCRDSNRFLEQIKASVAGDLMPFQDENSPARQVSSSRAPGFDCCSHLLLGEPESTRFGLPCSPLQPVLL